MKVSSVLKPHKHLRRHKSGGACQAVVMAGAADQGAAHGGAGAAYPKALASFKDPCGSFKKELCDDYRGGDPGDDPLALLTKASCAGGQVPPMQPRFRELVSLFGCES
ncbi:type II secretory pathway [Chlorella sorokiniana]|uniref:Type II secretory pathway n=1 Tax=Chlorella sorokiniana TaxID=3076 RepID=A0A2P6TG69_CHLSO|nr:type II secretory pathway [Chlorella sorokiniana]|eukprot:PRW33109.1 type II secretory pathway [Chlorella sorokiniana]